MFLVLIPGILIHILLDDGLGDDFVAGEVIAFEAAGFSRYDGHALGLVACYYGADVIPHYFGNAAVQHHEEVSLHDFEGGQNAVAGGGVLGEDDVAGRPHLFPAGWSWG